MKIHLIATSLLLFTITFSCKNNDMNQNTATADNPLLSSFSTPYGVPPFDLIRDEHYKPAFEAAMAIHKSEIDSIASIASSPDFNNTIVALDGAGSMLSRISNIFFNMTGAHTNETLEKISVEMAPVLAKHYDYIALHQKLFERVKTVWDNKASFQLNEEQNELLEKTYKSFIRNGALLGVKEKETITKINEELSSLTVKFGQNTLAEVNDFKLVVDKKDDLKGLSDDLKSAAADAAKEQKMEGKWLFTLHNPSVMPFLQYAEKRQ